MKHCKKCDQTKEYNEFYTNKNYADGRYSVCISCKKTISNKYYLTDEYRAKERLRHHKRLRTKNGMPLDTPRLTGVYGEGFITTQGYKVIPKRGHPNARKSGQIFEHVFIMSEHLGRPLTKNENVHHKNGDKLDNQIENLELWTRQQPSGQRVEDKIAWCKEFLDQYDYDVIKR